MATSFEATLIDHANLPNKIGLQKCMNLTSDTAQIKHIRSSFKYNTPMHISVSPHACTTLKTIHSVSLVLHISLSVFVNLASSQSGILGGWIIPQQVTLTWACNSGWESTPVCFSVMNPSLVHLKDMNRLLLWEQCDLRDPTEPVQFISGSSPQIICCLITHSISPDRTKQNKINK